MKKTIKKTKKYLVSANEILYYLGTEIMAENEEEAKEKYLAMMEDGEMEVNKSEIIKINIEKMKK